MLLSFKKEFVNLPSNSFHIRVADMGVAHSHFYVGMPKQLGDDRKRNPASDSLRSDGCPARCCDCGEFSDPLISGRPDFL